MDTPAGTAGNDTFNATHLTFNASDVLVGGAGTDTLKIIDSGSAAFTVPAARVSGIENIIIQNINGSTPVAGVAVVTAQAQVVTITTIAPTATTDDVTVTYGSLSQVVGTSGATANAQAAILVAVINGLAGATVAVAGTGANAHIITVTAPVAGTPLPFIGFSAMTNIAEAPTIAYTTPNRVAVTAVTEVLATTSQTDTVAAGNFTDATTFTTEASTGLVNFTGLTAAQTANMNAGSGGMGAGFGATVTAGTVNISGGTTAGPVAITGSVLTTATINSTGAPATATGAIGTNTIGTLTGAGTTTSTTINATSGLTTGAATNLGSTVTITGAGNVSFGATALEAGVTTLNASALTGNLTAVLGSSVTQTVTGGAGNDVITSGSILTTGSVNAGAGSSDILVVGAANHVNTAALAAKYTNFETIRSGVSLDMSLIAGITGLQVATATDITFSAMSAAQAANVTLRGSQTTDVTFAVTGATTVGQLDTLAITINDGVAAPATITAGDISAAGVENVRITATDSFTATALTGLTAMTNMTVTGAGNVSLTSGALPINVNTTIDASAVTGTVTVNFANGTSNGALIIGSATKANTLTGTAQSDVIRGGDAVDTITQTAGDDTITLGGGRDLFVLTAVAAAGEAKDVITDFVVGTDRIDVNFGLLPDDMTAINAGDLVAAEYVDVTAGVTTTTITGNGAAGIFEFSNVNDFLGEGTAGTFNAATATGAELLAAVVKQLNTDVAVAITDGNPGDQHLIFVMYDESGNAVIVNFSESDVAETRIDAADHMEFIVLVGVAPGTVSFADFV